MTIRKTAATVGTLAQGAVSTAVGVAKHPIGTASTAVGLAKDPIGTASKAVGLAKGVAGAGLDLVRGGHTDVQEDEDEATFSPVSVPETITETRPVEDDPRDDLPGPDLAEFAPPLPEDLPEPIVIEADDEPGEAFHNEPKPASREVAHGGTGTDFEEAEGFVEEIPEDLRTE